MAKSTECFNRKSRYSPVIYKNDYFVIKHLEAFLKNAINTYVQEGMVVADIGCGEQPLRDLIESKGGKYVGIDISQNSKNNVDVIAAITNIPQADNMFDCILCSEVLEHVQDTHSAFMEMTRLLHKGGYLIITTPFCYPLHEEPHDFVRLTRHCLLAESTANNLSVVNIQESGNELEVIATIWSNFFVRINNRTIITKICNVLARITMNSVVIVYNSLFCKQLPKKTYLNNLLILSK